MKKLYISLILTALILVNMIPIGVHAKQKTYSVGYNEALSPVQFIDDSGNDSGIAVDILKELGLQNDMIFEFFPISDDISYEEMNNFDLLINLREANDYNLENFSLEKLSENYYNIPLVLSGDHFFKEGNDITIAIFDYLYLNTQKVYDIFPDAEIKLYATVDELKRALYNNEANFMLSTTVTTNLVLREDTKKEFQTYPINVELPAKIAFSNNIPDEDIEKINNAILNFDKNVLADIIIKNSYDESLDESYAEKYMLYSYDDVISGIGFTMFIVICVGLIFFLIYRSYIEKITFYDKLTGFLTEYKFHIEMTRVLSRAEPNEYYVISIDIDNFKYINEMYDFAVGNTILKMFASYLEDVFNGAEIFSRINSDKFYVLIDAKTFENMDNRRHFSSENFSHLLGELYHIYTSTGIYKIDEPDMKLTTILTCVNTARNFGKSVHGNTSIEFTEKMAKSRQKQNKIVSNMEHALQDKEFEVYYQPKIDLRSQEICGAEALIRWIVRDGLPIFPDEFIPLFEKNRYITKLDFYVFEEVCMFISQNLEKFKNIKLSVNLSTITLLLEGLPELLLDIANKYGVPVQYLELEVTESAFVENIDFIKFQINLLKEFGFTIALDDFGSGISSLNQLKDMDVDVIKLDKGFLSSSLNEDKGIIIVENILILAKKLNLEIVAEGVETLENVNSLTSLGCDIAQGYYFAKPMPVLGFMEYVDNYVKMS